MIRFGTDPKFSPWRGRGCGLGHPHVRYTDYPFCSCQHSTPFKRSAQPQNKIERWNLALQQREILARKTTPPSIALPNTRLIHPLLLALPPQPIQTGTGVSQIVGRGQKTPEDVEGNMKGDYVPASFAFSLLFSLHLHHPTATPPQAQFRGQTPKISPIFQALAYGTGGCFSPYEKQ